MKAQERYKRQYDSLVQKPSLPLAVGEDAILRRDYKRAGETNKLASAGLGPYKIVSLSPTTAVIRVGNQEERVSVDRLEAVPPDQADGQSSDLERSVGPVEPPTRDEEAKFGINPNLDAVPPLGGTRRPRRAGVDYSAGVYSKYKQGSKHVRFAVPLEEVLDSRPQKETKRSWRACVPKVDSKAEVAEPVISSTSNTKSHVRIYAHLPRSARANVFTYRVRWLDSDEPDSWEPASALVRTAVIAYHNKRGMPLPSDLSSAIERFEPASASTISRTWIPTEATWAATSPQSSRLIQAYQACLIPLPKRGPRLIQRRPLRTPKHAQRFALLTRSSHIYSAVIVNRAATFTLRVGTSHRAKTHGSPLNTYRAV
eukprot:IDg21827t1